MAIAKPSNNKDETREKSGTSGAGSPVGMCPTNLIVHFEFKSAYVDIKVPPTTTMSSIGIGIVVLLATLDFSHSLLNTRIDIVMAEIIVAATFTSAIFEKISM
jgi:hypothetical protein